MEMKVKETTNKNVPQEDLVEELPQGCAEEEPLSILKVAFSICETDCFLESFSSSDTDDNADFGKLFACLLEECFGGYQR
ncbi:hypothetical protein MJT46_010552 [Ovis ammon polii x Ovis aries]|nr:hypothetical protein MJT46_010552 [Ovis ammon polii x Ovis aries]